MCVCGLSWIWFLDWSKSITAIWLLNYACLRPTPPPPTPNCDWQLTSCFVYRTTSSPTMIIIHHFKYTTIPGVEGRAESLLWGIMFLNVSYAVYPVFLGVVSPLSSEGGSWFTDTASSTLSGAHQSTHVLLTSLYLDPGIAMAPACKCLQVSRWVFITCDMCIHQGKNSIWIYIDLDLALIEGGVSSAEWEPWGSVCPPSIGLSLCSKSCKLQETAIELSRRLMISHAYIDYTESPLGRHQPGLLDLDSVKRSALLRSTVLMKVTLST